jgi:copper homeostasis protein CutC
MIVLIILPGAGISYQNAEAVAEALNVSEVHGTKIVDLVIDFFQKNNRKQHTKKGRET